MKVGFIGLGKMGRQMVTRLAADRHEVITYDVAPEAQEWAKSVGLVCLSDLAAFCDRLGPSPVVWLMVPSTAVDTVLQSLLAMLPEKSLIIDGGNSDYRETLRRASRCQEKGLTLVDIGTSGGVLGYKRGFSMMLGGSEKAIARIEPIVKSLAAPHGYRHVGETGAGHFVKMVHNAIEYGVMQAYAEGYELLQKGPYPQLNLANIADVWQHGSIIASQLNELAAEIFKQNPTLEGTTGYVAESGEAKWALEIAQERDVSMPVIAAAMEVRLASEQGKTSFATKLLALLRHAFGGHPLK